MITNIHRRLRCLPTPMTGLALGIATLGVCLELALPLHFWAQMICAFCALFFWGLLALRFILHPDTMLSDIRHPVLGSIVPTFTMCLMIMSVTFRHFSTAFGTGLWVVGLVLHLIAVVVFTYYRMREPNMEHMVPSWFIGPVGIIVADLTFPGIAGWDPFMVLLLTIGIVAYGILLPLMIYRLVFVGTLPQAAQPTIAIMAAPASLCLAGYVTVVKEPHLLLVALLFGIALLMTFFIYVSFWRLLRLKFSPGYAAFTFPMVVGPTALFKTALMLESHFPQASEYVRELRLMGDIELAIGAVVIIYVAILYLRNLPDFLAGPNGACPK